MAALQVERTSSKRHAMSANEPETDIDVCGSGPSMLAFMDCLPPRRTSPPGLLPWGRTGMGRDLHPKATEHLTPPGETDVLIVLR